MKLLDRLASSRWLGWLAVLLLAWSLWGMLRPWFLPRNVSPVELKIPSYRHDEMESQVQAHIAQIELGCRRIIDNPASTPEQRGRAYGEWGKAFIIYDLRPQAVACLSNAGKLDRSEFRWPYLLAHALRRETQLAEAAIAMGEAVRRMGPDASADPIDQLAGLCFLGELAQRLDDAEQSIRYFDQALKISPDCVFALFHRSQLHARLEHADLCLADLTEAYRLQPQSMAVRGALAAEFRRRGDLPRAMELSLPETAWGRRGGTIAPPDRLMASLLQGSRSNNYTNRQAIRLMEAGRYRAAAERLTARLRESPDAEMLLINRAMCYAQLEQYSLAERDLHRLSKLNPEHPASKDLWLRVRINLSAEREEALAEARDLAAREPNNSAAWLTLGRCLLEADLWDAAVAPLEQAVQLAPQEPHPRQHLLQALFGQGRYQLAAEVLEGLLRDFPQDTDLRLKQSWLLSSCPDEGVRNPTGALELADQLLELGVNAHRLEARAGALHALGRSAEAAPIITQAIEIYGTDGALSDVRRVRKLQNSIATGSPFRERWPMADPAREGAEEPNQNANPANPTSPQP